MREDAWGAFKRHRASDAIVLFFRSLHMHKSQHPHQESICSPMRMKPSRLFRTLVDLSQASSYAIQVISIKPSASSYGSICNLLRATIILLHRISYPRSGNVVCGEAGPF